jgi:hypothetical protein
MGVVADAAEVLNAGRLGDASAGVVRARGPRPVAFSRRADRGAVMFPVRRTTADWMAIVVLLDEVVAHPSRGHFVYLGEIERSDEPVTLTARRAGAEETVAFQPIGHR